MEKQIEEMEKISAMDCDDIKKSLGITSCIDLDCHDCIARLFYKKGYRKASEVAEEIIRYLRLNEDIAIKCKEENGEQNREYFKGKLAAYLQIRGFIEVELKRQYKEGQK